MDKKKLIPQQSLPVNRITTATNCSELNELSEEVLTTSDGTIGVAPSHICFTYLPAVEQPWSPTCIPFAGDDAE